MIDIEQSWQPAESRALREQTLRAIEGYSSIDFSNLAVELEQKQAAHLEQECLNLYPGTNIMSPRVTALLGSRLASRASEGYPGSKYQTGLAWAEKAEIVAAELVRRVFGTRFAEVRPLSGSMANMAVLNSLTDPGDVIFSLSTSAGGHISHGRAGAAGYRRLEIHDIPFDASNWCIDLDALRREARQAPPKLIIVGASLILFPYPMHEIRAIADEVGAYLMYDAAHVVGLIAGGCWQHPIREGAHVMTASTYKSFGGPPGGIIITDNPDIARGVERAIFPGMTANFHTNRIPALIAATAETMTFGQDYARECLANAQRLGKTLQAEGLTVAGASQGYTSGHMLALDVHEQGMGRAAAAALEAAHIICNFNLLPWDSPKAVRNPSGLRLAVQEITRWGAGPEEMTQIARFFRQVLLQKQPSEAVSAEVMAVKARLNRIQYCFPL